MLPIDLSGLDAEVTASVEIPLSEYLQECDAVVTGGTNAFFDSVTMLKPTFLADVGNPYYESIDWCKFSSGEELKKLISTYIENESDISDRMLELREMITVANGVSEKYKSFFDSLIG